MLELLTLTIIALVSFLLAMPTLYYVQKKDYLFMRIIPHLKEKGAVNAYKEDFFRFPAKSLRNFLVSGIILGVLFTSLIINYLLGFEFTIFSLTLCFGVNLLIAQLSVFLGVLITNPLAEIFVRQPKMRAATSKLNESKAEVVGITGSYGKSTVKEFLNQVLSEEFNSAATKENQNSEVGIALSILSQLNKDTDFFVAEMAAYHRGAIEQSCEVAPPKYGIITAIGNQHLAVFGSQRAIVETKSELLEALPKGGLALIPYDSEYFEYMANACSCPFIKFSLKNPKADIYSKEIKNNNGLIEAKITYKDNEFLIRTKLLGQHIIYNLLPVIALCSELGISRQKIQKAIEKLQPVPGKLSIHSGLNDATFLNDSYSSNEHGFKAALKVLKSFDHKNKLIITKGILELGSEKEFVYKRLADLINRSECNILTTDSLFNEYVDEARITLAGDEDELFNILKDSAGKDSVVLIEGRFSPPFIEKLNLSESNK